MSLALGLQAQLGGQSQLQRAINLLKSKGADAHLWDFSSFREAYGAELVTGNSSTFDSGTGSVRQNLYSTIAAVGGVLRVSQTAVNGRAALTVPCTPGRTYVLSVSVRSVSGAAAAGAGFSVWEDGNTAAYTSNASTTFQTITSTKVASEWNLYISLGANGDGSSVFEFDNISVKEVLSAAPGTTLPNVLYQDSAGTTPVTAPDQPIGLCLDSMGVLGSELAPASWSAYNATISGSTLPITATSTGTSNFGILEYPVGYVAGKKYKVSISWTTNSAEKNVSGDATGASNFGNAASGSATCYIDGDGGPVYAYCFGPPSIGSTLTITAYSLKEITGIHAAQSTSAKKPTLRRGIVNRLTYSHDLSNASWVTEGAAVKTGNVLSTPATASDVYKSVSVTAGATYTLAFKLSGSGTTSIFCYNTTNNVHAAVQVTLTSTPTIYTTVTTPTVSAEAVYFGRRAGDTATEVTFGGAALFTGTLTASEILAYGGIPLTTSAPASSSLGRYWAEFDGVDDALTLGAVPFQMADDHAVIGGANVSDYSGTPQIFNVGNTGVNNPRVAQLYVDAAGKASVMWRDDAGTIVSLASAASITVGSPSVISSEKTGASLYLRANGAQAATGTGAFGATTVNGASIGVGVFSGGNFMRGAISSVSAIKSTLTDAELLLIEKMAASKAGVTL